MLFVLQSADHNYFQLIKVIIIAYVSNTNSQEP